MSFLVDSGVTPAGASPPGGGGGSGSSPPGGGGGSGAAPPNSSVPPGVVAAPAVGVPPEVFPYNLSMLSNNPVLLITVGVAFSSSPTALSILCCCKSSLISSSDHPKICFSIFHLFYF